MSARKKHQNGKLSDSVLKLGFMVRAREKEEKKVQEEQTEALFLSTGVDNPKHKGTFKESSFFLLERLAFGRLSFGGYNEEVEKLAAERERSKPKKKVEEQADISTKEMVEFHTSIRGISTMKGRNQAGKHTRFVYVKPDPDSEIVAPEASEAKIGPIRERNPLSVPRHALVFEKRACVMTGKSFSPKSLSGRKLASIPAPWDPQCTPYCVTAEEFASRTRSLCSVEVETTASHHVRVSKVIVLGDMSVGKTSLVNRFCYEIFDFHYKATIGVDFEVERWDTAGAERFRCIASSYYRAAHVIVLAFDMSVPLTMERCSSWLEAAMESWDPKLSAKPLIFLIGCKMDLLAPMDYAKVIADAKEKALKMEAEFWPVSAKTGENVQEFFRRLAALSFAANIRDQMRREKRESRQSRGSRTKSIVLSWIHPNKNKLWWLNIKSDVANEILHFTPASDAFSDAVRPLSRWLSEVGKKTRKEKKMNTEKLKKLQGEVRIGGKGSARRKKKVVHRVNVIDDRKLQSTLKKLNCNPFPGVEEVNMFKSDGTVMHFNNPKVQLALSSNMVTISGSADTRQISEMLPKVLSQLGPEQLLKFCNLSSRAAAAAAAKEEEEEIPTLVDNFEAATIDESKVTKVEGDDKENSAKAEAEVTA
ncbi:unnamed protein product [Notodromas monacha]|uniref:Transcription factor BTF3 n=1 Tax=Notodromas monacha TaxID=399045 RepID=A0A7R9BCD2_9CRUS|nr:unnamed protein product [Notodromas monacha]CAG0912686.1 unnamed protein product [Notodromas monacha]